MQNRSNAINLLQKAWKNLEPWYESSSGNQPASELTQEESDIILQLAGRLKGNYPFQSPVYAGQMLKPPHNLAWAAYALTALINPNNHALDGGPPTSEMEKEVIPHFASMFGLPQNSLGHLTSRGTIANLEALWVARKSHPGKKIAFSSQAHYTHGRMCEVIGAESVIIPVSADGQWDMAFLSAHASQIGTLVVTMGTTGTGRVEPLKELTKFCEENHIRIHLDAAYGGYFKLLEGFDFENPACAIDSEPWTFTSRADCIVIDPHKHGMQPYGCGCVLFRNPEVGLFYKHDSPYTYFSSNELHLGEISLECSRAGAAAAALWATIQLFSLEKNGPMAASMAKCRRAAVDFANHIATSDFFELLMQPELDIVVYFPVVFRESGGSLRRVLSLSDISTTSSSIFQNGMRPENESVYLSLYKVPAESVLRHVPELTRDQTEVTVLRSVLMKPEHEEAVPELIRRIENLI